MSDVQTRPAVARGGRPSAARGGRGGFSSRGARSSRLPSTNGNAKHDQEPTSLPTLDDQGEIADLNKAHGSKIPIVKELFPDWSEVDILYALKETDGDETLTIERIIDGKLASARPAHPTTPRSLTSPSTHDVSAKANTLVPLA